MDQRLTAFIFSLLGGLWMLGSGGMMYGRGGSGGSWMWHQGMMRGMGMAPMFWWPWFGFVAGAAVLVLAAMLYLRPAQARTWGAVILIVSAVDALIGMGGLVAGTLGVIGGAMALGKPST